MDFTEGMCIKGKWNKHQYEILQLLGQGGIGKVYKVRDIQTGELFALKVSEDIRSITKEYEMMERFQKIPMTVKAREIDDLDKSQNPLYFIVMEYIEGENLASYRRNQKLAERDVIALGKIIGKAFDRLHDQGVIFGDLKLENLMIDKKNRQIKMIDLGGVTPLGQVVKEFTPMYDRASWNMGMRIGDEGYDLFSLCIFMAHLLLGEKKKIPIGSVDKLIKNLEHVDISPACVQLIHRGLLQKKITFENFVIKLDQLCIQRKNESFGRNGDRINKVVNGVFASSVLLFVGVISLLWIKRAIF